ncbi:formyltetrahydrofolate deformylase [Methylacidimicrobium cyclopophantes]|uniref:Formyltetrahydrofolate deformylase n=1 Tax=Methylacidimicrobium cyclopophantes TaxID=1041766 RepID=A0A5E6MQE2_9BACT|nr:formyltetrahydrofolate deformylase [Methylacidimicrobium cyclopophantes]VVM08350.1 formyltetrahydrofolate deformylase [Methylacidimicrobium cyclopophantes]
MSESAVLLITCPDRKGLVSSIANFLFQHDGNILHADQHQDAELGLFLMRVEWDLTGFALDFSEIPVRFDPIARRLGMQWRLASSSHRPRVAIFVSRQTHCLADLLYRYRAGELACEIPLIVSNHPDGRWIADSYGIPYYQIEMIAGRKDAAEVRQLELLDEHRIDLVVLARYMQILSPAMVARFPNRILNIHHSFLPAFSGAKPYHQAYERGVKLIGATSHYVTEILDDGPIIEQDVVRISHRDGVRELVQKGQDLEKVVLSRAVRWHVENRVLVYGRKTVVFS